MGGGSDQAELFRSDYKDDVESAVSVCEENSVSYLVSRS